jgi:hypothetical protein
VKDPKDIKKLAPFWRTVLEVGSILFFFYSNLLMGEYTGSGPGQKRGLLWAIQDIFTITNFIIACVLAFIGYVVFEIFRRRF